MTSKFSRRVACFFRKRNKTKMDFGESKRDPNRDRCLSFTQSATMRPPRRKRRPSVGVDGTDVSRLSSTAESLEDLRPSTVHFGRSGSVPPTPLTHSPLSTHSLSSPAPLPRIRRHFRQKSNLSVSPSSAPTITRGSSAIDLSDIAPFGCLQQPDSFQQSVKGFANNLIRRNSFKSGFSSNKWPWMWHKTGSGLPNKDPATISEPAPLKYSGSLLSGRKRKSRHISCPDISSASSESSRSTSPSSSSLKMSLTSLFHRTSPSGLRQSRPPPSAPVAIQRHPSDVVKTSANADSANEAEEALVGEFMSTIFSDENCENYLEEFAGLDFYPDTNDSR